MHIYLSISYRERHNYSLIPLCKNLSAYRGRQDNCSLCFFFSLIWSQWLRYFPRGFLAGSVVRNLPANAGDASLILDPGRSHMLRSSWAHESHSYWTCAREPGSYRYWAGELQLLKPGCPRAQAPKQGKSPPWEGQALKPEGSPWAPQPEKNPHSSEDPAQPK